MGSSVDRFFQHVDIRLGDCWRWKGSKDHDGYGRFKGKELKTVLAHRWGWWIEYGVLPKDKQIDHLCRTRECVNPLHMELVSSQENTARGNVGIHKWGLLQCKRGHEFTPENILIVRSHGKVIGRKCRTCNKLRAWEV